ncbi:MAG: PAS domain S-box protein [Thiotrichales bacterium]|nr:PAS domain S-box protein [Thiotrichales bacterium]
MQESIRLIARVDANGTIQYINNEYLTWTGYPSKELVGHPVSTLRSVNGATSRIEGIIKSQCQKNEPINFPVPEVKKNGERYWTDMRIQPIHENGQYIGYTSVKRLITAEKKIKQAELLYHKIEKEQVVFYSGEWIATAKHRFSSMIGLHKASLSQKIIAITASVSIVILALAFAYEQLEEKKIEHNLAINHGQNFGEIVDGLMLKKADLGITNAVAISASNEIELAATNGDQRALNDALSNISQKYSEMTDLKSVKLHFTDENSQSYYKSWLPLEKQEIVDLSDRGYMKKMATERKPMVVYAVGSAGFNIKSLIPIKKDGKFEGALELIQGLGSLRRDFAKTNRMYLMTISKDYIMAGDKYRQMNAKNIPVSKDASWVVGNNKQFSLEASGKQIDALQQIDLNTLFKQGYLTTSDYFHYTKPIYDVSKKLMGYHIVSEPIADYNALLNKQIDVAENAFIQLSLALTTMLALVLTLLWIMVIKPIRNTQQTMENSVINSDLFARVHAYGNDEIAQMAKAYNRQSMLAQVANAEVSSAMEEILAGRLNYHIDYPFQSDYGILKNRINETNQSLSTFFEVIGEVMTDLQNGDFNKAHKNTLNGAFAVVVNDCLTSMHTLSKAFAEINQVMSYAARGKFDERIQNFAAGDIHQLQTNLNQALQNIETGFEDIVEAAQRMAQGDLTQPIVHEYEFTIDQAKQAINESINGLSGTLSQVTDIAYQVQSGVRTVADGAQNLNQRTQDQAATLEKTSAAMEQTNSQIQNNLDNTKMAGQIAESQNHMLEEANGVMGETKNSMNNIQTASNQIKDITSLIDSIAFQTNLLALNAAVEAARAGEHGRGFAVVAGEVRNLAGKSADAAKEISTLIEQTSNAINVGVTQVDKVGNSLDQVTQETQRMLEIVRQVSIASQEQSQGVSEINSAIISIDSATQQNAALVEETTATAETLLESSEQLQNSVKAFQLQRKLR